MHGATSGDIFGVYFGTPSKRCGVIVPLPTVAAIEKAISNPQRAAAPQLMCYQADLQFHPHTLLSEPERGRYCVVTAATKEHHRPAETVSVPIADDFEKKFHFNVTGLAKCWERA